MEESSFPIKKKVGRPKKVVTEVPNESLPGEVVSLTTEVPKKRGRPRKVTADPPSDDTPPCVSELEPSIPADTPKVKTKKRRHQNEPDKAAWGRIVGNVSREIIPGQRLPQNRVVMQRYHTMRAMYSTSTTIASYANKLCDEILLVWKRAGIPTKERKTCVTRLNDLLSSCYRKRCRDMKNGSKEATQVY